MLAKARMRDQVPVEPRRTWLVPRRENSMVGKNGWPDSSCSVKVTRLAGDGIDDALQERASEPHLRTTAPVGIEKLTGSVFIWSNTLQTMSSAIPGESLPLIAAKDLGTISCRRF